jgi:hypothetical protein
VRAISLVANMKIISDFFESMVAEGGDRTPESLATMPDSESSVFDIVPTAVLG